MVSAGWALPLPVNEPKVRMLFRKSAVPLTWRFPETVISICALAAVKAHKTRHGINSKCSFVKRRRGVGAVGIARRYGDLFVHINWVGNLWFCFQGKSLECKTRVAAITRARIFMDWFFPFAVLWRSEA